MSDRKVLAAALGDCVHVAGALNFLAACRRHGWSTEFLGPAVAVDRLAEETARNRPDVLAVSYRLTAESAGRLLSELKAALEGRGLQGIRAVFGGPPPVAEVARRSGLFEAVFEGDAEVEAWLTGAARTTEGVTAGRDLLTRRRQHHPRPLLRHHFGLPTVERTVQGIERIARSGVVDVISIGPDQNAQEHFFHTERMDPAQDGAGGVPVRTPDDLRRLRDAAQTGNHPLLRCYSGTQDLLAWAELLDETIDNAWCAVPLFWYSELDGRSTRTLEEAIAENQALVEWSASRGIPVERNDQNQWGLRASHDSLQVATAALAARLAARVGVSTYVLQMMLNNPAGISPAMDIAKADAMRALVERHVGPDVTVLRELRPGLFSFPADPDRALGQLASAVRTAMGAAPDILHVVGHTEAHHAIEADELVTSCTLARQVVDDALLGLPDPLTDPTVTARRDLLVEDAAVLLDEIAAKHPAAWEGEPAALASLVRTGILDAPHLAGSSVARGDVVTVVDGGCDAVDPSTGDRLSERERLRVLSR
jgi:methylmalonyl-CoA mutase cobalamin-binding subunit